MTDNEKRLLWIGAALLLLGGGVSMYSQYRQRGIRNNNPGNLILTNINWQGKVPRASNTDGKFEQFTSPLMGIRAMYLDIRGDVRRGADTLRKLITRYAPPSENNTAAYIATVAKAIGKGADQTLTAADFPALLAAIIKHENGINPYPADLIRQAIAAAGG